MPGTPSRRLIAQPTDGQADKHDEGGLVCQAVFSAPGSWTVAVVAPVGMVHLATWVGAALG
jgi:hypothetical protein